MNVEAIPAELQERRQWVLWRYEERDGKPTKVPYQASGRRASSTDPATWTTFEEALAGADRLGMDGVGFVFTSDDPYFGVDLDHELSEGDRGAIALALDTYTEFSVSGAGMHVIGRGRLDNGRHPAGLGVFDRGRYFVMTGEHVNGTPTTIEERQPELDDVLMRFLPRSRPTEQTESPPSSVNLDDQELLERMFRSKSGEKIRRLWEGDWSDYPSRSQADQALCNHLAFWTSNDPGRIDELFRASALYRAKWDREDYAQRTIDTAIAATPEGYRGISVRSSGSDSVPEDDEAPFRLPVLTAAEICQLPDPPASDELLGPVLVRGHRTLVGAHTGEGKTEFTFRMIRAVVLGEDFLDWTGPGGMRALVVDAEQGLRTVKRRLVEAGLDACGQIDYVRVPDGLALDSDPAQIAAVEQLLAEGGYSVVALDPAYKLTAVTNSNDELAVRNLMRRFDRWRTEHHFALILPVHLRKPIPGEKTFTIHDVFGSTAYVRGAEVVLGVRRVSNGFANLHFFKDRDGDLEVGAKWPLLFDHEHGFRRAPDSADEEAEAAQRLVEFVRKNPGESTTQVSKTVEGRKATLTRILRTDDRFRCQRVGSADLWFLSDAEDPFPGDGNGAERVSQGLDGVAVPEHPPSRREGERGNGDNKPGPTIGTGSDAAEPDLFTDLAGRTTGDTRAA